MMRHSMNSMHDEWQWALKRAHNLDNVHEHNQPKRDEDQVLPAFNVAAHACLFKIQSWSERVMVKLLLLLLLLLIDSHPPQTFLVAV